MIHRTFMLGIQAGKEQSVSSTVQFKVTCRGALCLFFLNGSTCIVGSLRRTGGALAQGNNFCRLILWSRACTTTLSLRNMFERLSFG